LFLIPIACPKMAVCRTSRQRFWRGIPTASLAQFIGAKRPTALLQLPVASAMAREVKAKAGGQAGYALDCKSMKIGSIPIPASKFSNN